MFSLRNKMQKAFTLVELLVVISIIAVLLAILLPTLSQAREQAKRVVCASNFKQFGLAWTLYCEAYGGKTMTYSPTIVDPDFWIYKLAPFFSDKNFKAGSNNEKGVMAILKCSSAGPWRDAYNYHKGWGGAKYSWRWPGDWSPTNTRGFEKPIEGGIGLNNWVRETRPQDMSSPSDAPKYYKRYDDIPSNVPIFCDSAWPTVGPYDTEGNRARYLKDLLGGGDPVSSGKELETSLARLMIARHGKSINVMLKGLNVEKKPLEEIWAYQWHQGFNTSRYPKLYIIGKQWK